MPREGEYEPSIASNFKSINLRKLANIPQRSLTSLFVFFMILGSLFVLTGAAAAAPVSPPWPSDSAWMNYTIAGEPVRDYEDKPYENDPSHGIANVQPKAVDIASGVDASGGGAENNPGNFTSVQWVYDDQLGNTVGMTNIDDDWLFFRMRVADDPKHTGKYYYMSYHWDVLIDTDGDIWNEFVIDINGGGGTYKFGTVGVYYNNSDTYEYDPAQDAIWEAEASSNSNDYTRATAIDYGPSYTGLTQYWVEYAIPVTKFKDDTGTQLIGIDTEFRLFFSTSASMTNPLQKDWMAEYVFAGPPNVTVYKTVEETYVNPGDMIHYTIYYNNSGESNAAIVWINDTLSEHVSFHSSNISYYSYTGNTYSWKLENVKPGNHSFMLNVTADKYLSAGTEIINYVHLEYYDAGGTLYPESEDSVKSYVIAPSYTLTKTADETEVYPGDDIHYQIEFTNTGSGCSAEVWVNDTIPSGTTFKECSPAYYSMSGSQVVWKFTNICPATTKIIYLNVTTSTTLGDGDILTNDVELLYTDSNENYYP
ncbi:MAG: DUF11 domain-containing protein, partial [Thermoplasmata archaeon]